MKYRFIEVDKGREFIKNFTSKVLPVGAILEGMNILFSNGKLYQVVNLSLDLEISEPEYHVELLMIEE